MTFAERVQAVAEAGFTDRQAGFLVTVMVHSGVASVASTAPTRESSTARRTRLFLYPCGRMATSMQRRTASADLPRAQQVALRRDWRARQP